MNGQRPHGLHAEQGKTNLRNLVNPVAIGGKRIGRDGNIVDGGPRPLRANRQVLGRTQSGRVAPIGHLPRRRGLALPHGDLQPRSLQVHPPRKAHAQQPAAAHDPAPLTAQPTVAPFVEAVASRVKGHLIAQPDHLAEVAHRPLLVRAKRFVSRSIHFGQAAVCQPLKVAHGTPLGIRQEAMRGKSQQVAIQAGRHLVAGQDRPVEHWREHIVRRALHSLRKFQPQRVALGVYR